MGVELIGREDDLRSTERFLDAISEGATALVIGGEAGAGKTSLWEAASAAAADRGQLVLSAAPAEAEASFAYAALGDLLRPCSGAAHGLPPPQQRVAGLVAEGLATKQVAAALFVSPKTVEGHLSRIYAKLGVHSRTELARRLLERR